jgi:hypothetical protein
MTGAVADLKRFAGTTTNLMATTETAGRAAQ